MMHVIARTVEIISAAGVVASSGYYLVCLWSAANFLRHREKPPAFHLSGSLPPVSILKPLKGVDPEIYESFRSHCLQNYPEYEIVFGVSDQDDPAIAQVEKLQREFPQRSVRLILCRQILGTNVKVSNLVQMLPHAHHEMLVVNDSDIRVPENYLRDIAPPLLDDKIGMVTCLYRGVGAGTLGSRLEALGISTDFSAGVLTSRQLEGIRFGLGSTLAFRRRDLNKIGGFQALLDYLGDDYELGKRIAALGLAVELSPSVVETFLPPYALRSYLTHQLRWARGIRDARPGGYLGLILTFGTAWALLAMIAGGASAWSLIALGLTVLLRGAVAIVVGGAVLRDPRLRRDMWLIPLRDILAVFVWLASLFGNTVVWRGQRFRLHRGRLTRI